MARKNSAQKAAAEAARAKLAEEDPEAYAEQEADAIKKKKSTHRKEKRTPPPALLRLF